MAPHFENTPGSRAEEWQPERSVYSPSILVPLTKAGAGLLYGAISQRYKRGSIIIKSNLTFYGWIEVCGLARLTGAILDRLTPHVHILEMNAESLRRRQGRKARR